MKMLILLPLKPFFTQSDTSQTPAARIIWFSYLVVLLNVLSVFVFVCFVLPLNYRSSGRFRISPIEPQILLANVVPLPWSMILNAFSIKNSKHYYKNYDKIEKSPENLNTWNWGAFYFGWLWAVCNGIYWPLIILLLTFIPVVGWLAVFVINIILGINGNKWAWEKKHWNSVYHFNKVQHSWAIAALWFFVGSIIFSFMFIIILSLNIISCQ